MSNRGSQESSFVSSQTITVFDNLANETFTVVNTLQISQYRDHNNSNKDQDKDPQISDFNLYACIVDADVRHNYATLGVRFRESPIKAQTESNQVDTTSADAETTLKEDAVYINRYSNFDLFRQDHMRCK